MNNQKELLKWLIENPNWLLKTQDEIFSNSNTDTKIFSTAKRILKTGKPISFDQLRYTLSKYPDLVESLNLLQNQSTVDKATALQIRTDLRNQALQQWIKRSANLKLEDEKSQKEYIKRLTNLSQDEQPEDELHITSFKNWKTHIGPNDEVVDSGFTFLADTGSDFTRGMQVNLIAPSGQFKSGAMGHIARHQIAKGRNVLFFAMEEMSHKFNQRIAAGLLKMTPYQYRQLTPEQIEMRFSTMNLGNLDVVTGGTIYAEELEDIIVDQEEKQGYKYDYVIIDYSAQIKLKYTKKASQEWQEYNEIFRQLKLVAANPNNPKIIISAIQSNRDGYNKKKAIGLHNASSSMGGVHASDMVFGLKYTVNKDKPFRESEAEEEADDIKGFVKIEVIKKREGTIQIGSKYIYSHLATGNIRLNQVDWQNEEDAEQWDNLFEVE